MSINDATPSAWDKATKAANSPTTFQDPYDAPAKNEVTSPDHYTFSKIECIAYLEDNMGAGYEFFLEGNIKKYLHRFRYKNSEVTDLRKAQFYLDRLIRHIEQED